MKKDIKKTREKEPKMLAGLGAVGEPNLRRSGQILMLLESSSFAEATSVRNFLCTHHVTLVRCSQKNTSKKKHQFVIFGKD